MLRLRLLLLLVCAGGATSAQSRAPQPAVNRAYLDTTCSPCKDFYRFANGAWLDSATIPHDRVSWGPRDQLQGRNSALVKEILDSLAYAPERHAQSPLERKVGTFFRACMEPAALGTGALRTLEPELRRIDAVRTSADLSTAVGRLWRHRIQALFWLIDIPDPTDPTHIVAGVRGLTGWSLRQPRVYLAADSSSARTRDAYVVMLTRVFEGLGDQHDSAALNARRVLAFETAIARARPANGPVTKYSMQELRRSSTTFDWQAFARALGRPDLRAVNMEPAAVVRVIDSLAAAVPVADWKAYLRWMLVSEVAPNTDAFGGAVAAFGRMISGRLQDPPRAQQCGFLTTFWLGDGVGQAYVSRAFSPEGRNAARTMAEGMRAVLRERIAALDWLGAESRSRALIKLNAMQLWIGYPDRWEGYETLNVRDGDHMANLLAARRYAMDRRMAHVGTKVDRTRWTEANPAFYDVSNYDITVATLVTAAALQPPFFEPRGDAAANYAATGSGIGHELSHAFDSNGRLYNEIGKREDWWTPNELQEFNRRADLIVQQYNEYVIVDSIKQNGRRTLSENISDIGGVTLAWLSYQRAMQGRPREIIDGLTPEQRFFIAYAQLTYRQARRPEFVRDAAQTDGHSAPQWRVNGPLSHLPAFAAAFGCKEGDLMVRPAALRWTVW